ncbi:unnamed protein product, partial [Rotaria sp. Silwood2]
VLTISNLVGAAPLSIKAAGGFPDYEFPRWSVILGWFIFAFCILPIPLVFIINYIREYRRLAAEKLVSRNFDTDDNRQLENDHQEKPLYLAALTENNMPADSWGPRRRKHQTGVYSHLAVRSTNKNISSKQQFRQQSSIGINKTDTKMGITNPIFNPDSAIKNDGDEN